MRIAYISGSYLPSRQANSIHVMRMTDALARLGHEVTLYARTGATDGNNQSPSTQSLREYYGVSGAAKVRLVPTLRFAQGRELLYAWQLRRLVTEEKPDLLYGRHVMGLVACQQVAPIAYEIHSIRSGLSAFLESRLLQAKQFSGIVSITHKLADDFRSQHQVKTTIAVEPDAVDCVDYDLIDPVSLPGAGRLAVGYCGHLYPGRGGEFLIELAGSLPEIDFHLVGGEDIDIERCRDLARGLPNLHFHGFVQPQRIPKYLKAFDVLVAPYQQQVQAFGKENIAKWISPMKLFEYMDAGKPIVVSDLSVLHEVITDQEIARLVPAGNLNAWTSALRDLLDSGQRERLGIAAKELVRRRYTWTSRAERILQHLAIEPSALIG